MSKIERVQYKFMIPVHLKAALEEAAHDNRRSLSAEVIHRLFDSFEMDEYQPTENIQTDETVLTMAKELVRRLEAKDAARGNRLDSRKK